MIRLEREPVESARGLAHSKTLARGSWAKGLLGRLFSVLLAVLPDAFAAAPPSTNATQPFFRLREATLAYRGPTTEFTNLTECRLGWFGPHDATNELGAEVWWAANLAVQEANAQTGQHAPLPTHRPPPEVLVTAADAQQSGERENLPLGLPFRLVPRWAVDPWGTGVSQLTRMIYDDSPLALLAAGDSAATHLAEQVVAKAQLSLVSPFSTDKSVTLAGVSWMFCCAPSDALIARVLVEDLLCSLPAGSNRLVVLSTTDHESRQTLREVLKEFSRLRHPPDFRFEMPPGAGVLNHHLAALEQARPDAVLIVATAADAATLVRAVRTRLPDCPLFGTHTMGRTAFVRRAGQAAEGVRFARLFTPDPGDPVAAKFLTQFARQHQHPPDYAAAFTYDATRLLLAAVRAGGFNRARVRQALLDLSPWPGITGPIHFDGTGQNTSANVRMGTIRDGAVVPLTTLLSHSPALLHDPKR